MDEELIREYDPDADRPYEDETEFLVMHTYGQGYSRVPVGPRDLNSDVPKKASRKPGPYGNPIGSGFSPAEVATAREKHDEFMKKLRDQLK